MSPSWESRLEAARKARTEAPGESGSAASRDLPLPENVTWHRVSLVTPVLEGWKIVTGVLAFVTVQNLDELVRAYRFISEHGFTLGGGIGYYLLGLIAFIALWVGLGLLSWWRRAYAVDADGVYLRSGILSRKLRTARLPRIQSVDVVHPLLGRIFGLGQLTVEVAGGRDSRVVIGFLTTRELQTLRDRILDLAAGQIDLPGPAVEGGAVGAGAEGRDTGGIDNATSAVRPEGIAPEGAAGSQAAPGQRAVPVQASHFQEYPLYSVDGSVLLGSLLRSVSLYLSLILPTVVIVVGIIAYVVDDPPRGRGPLYGPDSTTPGTSRPPPPPAASACVTGSPPTPPARCRPDGSTASGSFSRSCGAARTGGRWTSPWPAARTDPRTARTGSSATCSCPWGCATPPCVRCGSWSPTWGFPTPTGCSPRPSSAATMTVSATRRPRRARPSAASCASAAVAGSSAP